MRDRKAIRAMEGEIRTELQRLLMKGTFGGIVKIIKKYRLRLRAQGMTYQFTFESNLYWRGGKPQREPLRKIPLAVIQTLIPVSKEASKLMQGLASGEMDRGQFDAAIKKIGMDDKTKEDVVGFGIFPPRQH